MPIPWILAGAVTLVAVGAAAWGMDESGKRKKEQALYRSKIEDLECKLNNAEIKLDDVERTYKQLREQLGEEHRETQRVEQEKQQLEAVVRRLRRELTDARRRIALIGKK